MKKRENIAKYLEEFLQWADSLGLKTLLNTGEVADSLGVPDYVDEFLKISLPLLEKHPHHKILFLTKGGMSHIRILEKIPKNMRKHFIVSFSINPLPVARKYEKGTAAPLDRIMAAKKSEEMEFEVRIRIDPIIPIEGWPFYYNDLIYKLCSELNPSRITIGSLRALKKTIKYAKDKSWLKYINRFSEKTTWGLRIEHKLRMKMFELIISILRDNGYKGPIALCKEPLRMWKELKERGLLEDPGEKGIWEKVLCNCKL